jgi:hypothetical protein
MSASTIERIDAKLNELDPQSTRYQVLAALRRFRASWVELGRMLVQVQRGGDYREWGYDDFEVYCARELGLKKPTVEKLMVSYRYMQRNAPDRLAALDEDDGSGPPPEVPEYQTVELLQKMQDNDEMGAEDKQRFHRLAFDEGAEQTQLRKDIRGALSGVRNDDAGEGAGEREMQDILRTGRALRRKLTHAQSVPEGLRERFERLLDELEALAAS